MRLMHPLSIFICLAAAACGSSSSDPSILDEGFMGRAVAPPALVPTDTEAEHEDQAEVSAETGHTTKKFNNVFSGTVDGYTLVPSYSFFLQGIIKVGDTLPTLVFVQTDAPNLCQHIAAGTMPKNATIFAAALMQTDGQPVQENFGYTAPGHHELDEDPRSIASFRKLNDSCEILPTETGAQAMYGQAIIRKLVPETSVTVDYAYDFEDMGNITGHVEAPFCNAQSFFANPEQFNMPIEPQNCRDF